MIKYIDALNESWGFVDKKAFDYECTYAWVFVLKCLFLGSFVLFLFSMFTYLNLLLIAFDTMNEYGLTSDNMATGQAVLKFCILGMDFSILQLIGSVNPDSVVGNFVNQGNKIVLSFVSNKKHYPNLIFSPTIRFIHNILTRVSSFFTHSFHYVMGKVCKKIEK